MPTIFSRIISGELPGRFVWRDSRVVGGAIARSGPAFWNCVAAANCARSDQKATSGPDVAAVPIFSGAFTSEGLAPMIW